MGRGIGGMGLMVGLGGRWTGGGWVEAHADDLRGIFVLRQDQALEVRIIRFREAFEPEGFQAALNGC